MTAKNAEGYPDPTAEEAIRHVMRGGKLDYTSFRTYEELQDYTIKHNKGINTREAADKFIREKMPKESYFQKKILDWIKDNAMLQKASLSNSFLYSDVIFAGSTSASSPCLISSMISDISSTAWM